MIRGKLEGQNRSGGKLHQLSERSSDSLAGEGTALMGGRNHELPSPSDRLDLLNPEEIGLQVVRGRSNVWAFMMAEEVMEEDH